MKKAKIVLVVILLAVIIGGVVAYRMWNKPHDNIEDIAGTKVTVAEITAAYNADEAKANKKYLNKAIVISGTVTEIENNQDGKLLIILDEGVQCAMRDKNVKVDVGSAATIKGVCSGSSLFGVLLSGCVMIK